MKIVIREDDSDASYRNELIFQVSLENGVEITKGYSPPKITLEEADVFVQTLSTCFQHLRKLKYQAEDLKAVKEASQDGSC